STETAEGHDGPGADPRRSTRNHRPRPVIARHHFSPLERLSRRRQECTLGTMLEVLVGLVAGLLVLAGVVVMLGPNAKKLVRRMSGLRRRHPSLSVFQPTRTREITASGLNPKTQRVLEAASRLGSRLRAHNHEEL